jgi:hypothetical protein
VLEPGVRRVATRKLPPPPRSPQSSSAFSSSLAQPKVAERTGTPFHVCYGPASAPAARSSGGEVRRIADVEANDCGKGGVPPHDCAWDGALHPPNVLRRLRRATEEERWCLASLSRVAAEDYLNEGPHLAPSASGQWTRIASWPDSRLRRVRKRGESRLPLSAPL